MHSHESRLTPTTLRYNNNDDGDDVEAASAVAPTTAAVPNKTHHPPGFDRTDPLHSALCGD